MFNYKNIFLTDDDEDDRDFFREALNDVAADVVLTTSKDGQELLTLMAQPPMPLPDLIFVDINMPKVGGMQCVSEIRSFKQNKGIYIIAYSTSRNPEDVEAMHNLGANLYMVKPSNYESLKKGIRKVLSIDFSSHEQPLPFESFYFESIA